MQINEGFWVDRKLMLVGGGATRFLSRFFIDLKEAAMRNLSKQNRRAELNFEDIAFEKDSTKIVKRYMPTQTEFKPQSFTKIRINFLSQHEGDF